MMGELPVAWASIAVATSVVLASLTWRFVEQPIRNWKPTGAIFSTPLRKLVPFVATMILCFLVGLLTYIEHGFNSRFSAETLAAVNDSRPVSVANSCEMFVDNHELHATPQCNGMAQTKNSVVVWGDSHARHYFPGVKQYLQQRNIDPILIAIDGCPPLAGVERIDDNRQCADNTKLVLDHLIHSSNISTVVLAGFFVGYAEPQPFGLDAADPVRLIGLDSKARTSQSTLVSDALTNTINMLVKSGKKVIVMEQIPQQIVDESRCHARKAMWPTIENKLDCDVPVAEHLKRSRYINATIERLSKNNDNVCVFRPELFLCTSLKCMSEVDGHSIYHDSNHLNDRGSKFIAQFFNFERCLPAK